MRLIRRFALTILGSPSNPSEYTAFFPDGPETFRATRVAVPSDRNRRGARSFHDIHRRRRTLKIN
jgi:hypothetical protein